MAIKGGHRFGIRFEELFPSGCVMGVDPVVKVTDFEKRGKGDDQERDKQNGMRVWAVRVHDLDPDLEGKAREVVVKISADVQPVPPVGAFQQVEFEGLTVTPWLDDKAGGRMKYSIRAGGFRDARQASRPAPKTAGA